MNKKNNITSENPGIKPITIPELVLKTLSENLLDIESLNKFYTNHICNPESHYVSRIKKDQINKSFNDHIINPNNICFQIDLPYYLKSNQSLNKAQSSNKRVMLLGQDAKRSENKKDASKNEDLILSCPYYFQETIEGHTKPNSVYYQFITQLFDSGYDMLYLTDIFKIYYHNNLEPKNKVSSKRWKEKNIEIFELILLEEIKQIDPDLIIAMGKHAYDSLLRTLNIKQDSNTLIYSFDNKKIIHIPHISIIKGQISIIRDYFLAMGEIINDGKMKSTSQMIELYRKL